MNLFWGYAHNRPSSTANDVSAARGAQRQEYVNVPDRRWRELGGYDDKKYVLIDPLENIIMRL